MTKSRCPIEENNQRKGLEKCPFENMCNSEYKKICNYNRKLVNKLKIKII